MFKKLYLLIIVIFIFSNTTFIAYASSDIPQEEKVIYLTFDDGISKQVTENIVDILNSENVKGTFFLIGSTLADNKDCLNKIIKSGHSVGLHSYSHNRNKVYSSKENFVSEMKKCDDTLFELTGTRSTIIRFPFGTTNNSFKMTKDWESYIHKNNFKIFDWNVDTNDGSNPKNSSYNIYKASLSKKNTVILLMHSTNLNKNSALALKEVIKYYKEKGYTFKAIDASTPEMYKFKNTTIANFFEFN